MNCNPWIRIIALTLFAAPALPLQLAAQDHAKHNQPHRYHHYQIADPGTFGGPQTFLTLGTLGAVGVLNNQGALGGAADTSAIDPICGNHPPDCYASHAFVFQNVAKTDLGILPDGINSQVNWVSANGLITGNADNTHTDPLLGTPFQIRGTFWGHDGVITDIGALPDTYFAYPFAVNNRGEVVGQGLNTIPDAYSIYGQGYQARAFYWKNGMMQDLGTLGTGTDAVAGMINERGQVVGVSYTNAIPSAVCANFGYPLATGSFIWDNKSGMSDIGGLGGTCTLATDLNNRSQIVGVSALTGDSLTHPFVWDAATGVTDLMGASNGFSGYADAINDGGQIVGQVCDAVTCHAALWRKHGGKWQETDLGIFAASGCPEATSVNASAQVVGTDYCANLPFLSEDGANIVDLNTLVPPNSGLQLGEVAQINDRGEIAVNSTDANLNNHSVVLIPCDENHPGVAGCDYETIDALTAAASANVNPVQRPAVLTPGTRMPGMLNRFRSPKGRPAPVGGIATGTGASLSPSARIASADLLGDHRLLPQYGTPPLVCVISNGTLNGSCIQNTGTNTCKITSTGCPMGRPATEGGEYRCAGGNTIWQVSTTECFSVPGFDVSLTGAGLTPTTVTAGGSATATVSVAAYGGFSGSIAYTCSVQPAPALAPACSFSPGSVTSGTSSTLTVSTTAPTHASLSGTGSGLFYAFFLPLSGLFAMVIRFGPRQEKRRKKITVAALTLMLFAGVVFQAACGTGKPPSPGTPAGTYLIAVTGTDASGTVVSSVFGVPFYVQ
jgi:probable HAF family extracellular repeat protein